GVPEPSEGLTRALGPAGDPRRSGPTFGPGELAGELQVEPGAAALVEDRLRVSAGALLDAGPERRVLGQPDQVLADLGGLVAVDLDLQGRVVRDLGERAEVVHDGGPALGQGPAEGPRRLTRARVAKVDDRIHGPQVEVERLEADE